MEGNRAGRKATISETTFDSVVDEFSSSLQGGKAMSKGALERINELVGLGDYGILTFPTII